MVQNKPDVLQKKGTLGRPSTGQLILLGIGLVLAIGAFIFLRGFVACWRLTSLPGIPLPGCTAAEANSQTPQTNALGTPLATDGTAVPSVSAPELQLPDPWDGASRVTVLAIGLDYRDWAAEEGAPRSDTMILLTIDPVSKTAGMLSIPRDMWVNIPGGFGYGKINTAYSLGEGNKLPGGGAGLAIKTVEDFLGVPIHYFVQIDFQTFERMIDEIGGVKITVKEPIKLGLMGGEGEVVTLEPGRYTLDGRYALAYARQRYTEGGDVDRAARTQEVIMAILDRVMDPNYWPMLASKAFPLYEELSGGIHTDMSPNDAMRLGLLVRQIPRESIKTGVIDYSMVTLANSPDNLDIFVPIPDKIRALRDEIFTVGGALSPMAQGEPLALMQAEAARISVLNASYVEGLAAKTGEYLTGQGMNVVNVGNPAEFPPRTMVIDHTGKPYTLKFLMALMNLTANQIRIRYDPAAQADVEILLSADWASSNPMP